MKRWAVGVLTVTLVAAVALTGLAAAAALRPSSEPSPRVEPAAPSPASPHDVREDVDPDDAAPVAPGDLLGDALEAEKRAQAARRGPVGPPPASTSCTTVGEVTECLVLTPFRELTPEESERALEELRQTRGDGAAQSSR